MNQWKLRWQEGRIGFHLSEVNPYLVRHFDQLLVPKIENIFVPLCGKTLDLIWLAGNLKKVVGVEIIRKPVEEFFMENSIKYNIHSFGQFEIFKSDSIEIFLGDFFALENQKIGQFKAIYDRASIVAIEAIKRKKYVDHLVSFLSEDGIILLVTLEYDQNQMHGPPYSVSFSEVEKMFFKHGKIELLETKDIIDDRLRKKGVDLILEKVIKITKQ